MDQREAVDWIKFFRATNKDMLTRLTLDGSSGPFKPATDKDGHVKYIDGRPQAKLPRELNKKVDDVRRNAKEKRITGHFMTEVKIYTKNIEAERDPPNRNLIRKLLISSSAKNSDSNQPKVPDDKIKREYLNGRPVYSGGLPGASRR